MEKADLKRNDIRRSSTYTCLRRFAPPQSWDSPSSSHHPVNLVFPPRLTAASLIRTKREITALLLQGFLFLNQLPSSKQDLLKLTLPLLALKAKTTSCTLSSFTSSIARNGKATAKEMTRQALVRIASTSSRASWSKTQIPRDLLTASLSDTVTSGQIGFCSKKSHLHEYRGLEVSAKGFFKFAIPQRICLFLKPSSQNQQRTNFGLGVSLLFPKHEKKKQSTNKQNP